MGINLVQPGRRMIGLVMGLVIGLAYGLVADNINVLLIREIPLHYSLSHSLASTIRITLILGAMGYLVNWAEHGVVGIALTSILGAVALVISSFSALDGELYSLISLIFIQMYLFLPLVILFVPVNLLLRWAAARFYNHPEETLLGRNKSRAVLLVLFLAVFFGSFSLYDKEARVMMQRMQGYIRSAQATGTTDVPVEFRPVVRAVQNAGADFTLDWTDDVDKFPMAVEFEDTVAVSNVEVVFAYFDNGEMVACLFRTMDQRPYLCVPGQ